MNETQLITQKFFLVYGDVIGVIVLAVPLLILFLVYYFVTTRSLSQNQIKLRSGLDGIAGIAMPFIGLWMISVLDDLIQNTVHVMGLINDEVGYITLILSIIVFGIFSFIKRRRVLGATLLATLFIACVWVFMFITGV